MQGRPEVTRLGFRVIRAPGHCPIVSYPLNHAATAGAYACRHAGVDRFAMTMGEAVDVYGGQEDHYPSPAHDARRDRQLTVAADCSCRKSDSRVPGVRQSDAIDPPFKIRSAIGSKGFLDVGHSLY